jgi:hypothetical protein
MSNNKSSQIVSQKKYNSPEERMGAMVSIVKGCKDSKIVERITIETLFGRINCGLSDFSRKLRRFKLTNEALYETTKKFDVFGFIPGLWEKREDSKCKEYVPLIALDIDYLSFEADGSLSREAYRLFCELKMSEYVFAAYPSLGGGLRFLVWTESYCIENHKDIYAKVVEYFCLYLNLPVADSQKKMVGIDNSCSNPSRQWLFVPQNLFYLEANASAFPFTPMVEEKKIYQPIESKVIVNSNVTLGLFESIETQLMKHIDLNLNKSYSGRNNRLFQLALRFRNNDVAIESAMDYCSQFIEKDFTMKEIQLTIQSAYNIAKVQYTVAQAYQYIQNHVAKSGGL